MPFVLPPGLAALSDIEPIVWLLPLVAAYAAWRAVVYAKQKRWAIFIPVVFVIAICIYEFALQLYRNLTNEPSAPPAMRQIEGDPGGSEITVPPDAQPPRDQANDPTQGAAP